MKNITENIDISLYELRYWAESVQVSTEIAAAIWERAKSNRNTVCRIWDDPTSDEKQWVTDRAWELADDDTNVLHWGDDIPRPEQPVPKPVEITECGEFELIEAEAEPCFQGRSDSELGGEISRPYPDIAGRRRLIADLCRQRGSWGDGTEAHPDTFDRAAEYPGEYDLDVDTLDDAVRGDVEAIADLRSAWGLGYPLG